MSRTPLLSLPQSPSASTIDLAHTHDPSLIFTSSAPTPTVQPIPSASTALPDVLATAVPSPSRLHRRRPPVVPLLPDEEAAATRVSSRYVMVLLIYIQQSIRIFRVASRLTTDHISVLFPDVSTPFRDIGDIVDRLLPYHVFQHPREDLLQVNKGKRRATETEILQSEFAGASSRQVWCRSLAYGIIKNKICLRVLQAPTCARRTFSSCQDKVGQGRLRSIYSPSLTPANRVC